MAQNFKKNNWIFLFVVLSGIILGSYLGELTKEIEALSWLNYGFDFSLGNPQSGNNIILDLKVIIISFGAKISITIGSIIGFIVSLFIFKKI